MAFCSNCGTEINNNDNVCSNCGNPVNNQAIYGASYGNSMNNNSAPNYGNTPSSNNVQEDNVSVGLCILGFLIPLFGFIYWPCVSKDTPKRGKAVGITSIVSFALQFILGFVIGFIGAAYSYT